MPIFTFRCEKCEKIEDRTVKYSEIDDQVCSCQESAKMLHQFNPSGNFILKGVWYKNSKRY